jgi:phospholipid-binding lipoprotein MlaA
MNLLDGALRAAVVLALALSCGGPAPARADDDFPPTPLWDPLERSNRGIFDFNLWLSDHAIEPIAEFWAKVTPSWLRHALGRSVYNARAPQRIANNLLQLKPKGVGLETGRVIVNTTVGMAGFFDAAGIWLHWYAPRAESFGQTLGHYGMPSGPYLMVPIFGPSTVRDGGGGLVDIAFNPLTWLAGGGIALGISTGVDTLRVVNQFSLDPELMQDLDLFTLDAYIAVQDVYQQRMEAAIRE